MFLPPGFTDGHTPDHRALTPWSSLLHGGERVFHARVHGNALIQLGKRDHAMNERIAVDDQPKLLPPALEPLRKVLLDIGMNLTIME